MAGRQGAADAWRRLAAAVTAAALLVGFGGCATLLVTGAVKPGAATGATAEAAALASRVQSALQADGRFDAGRIGVAASGSTVTLSGEVADRRSADAAASVAAAVSGVSRVVNQLSPADGS